MSSAERGRHRSRELAIALILALLAIAVHVRYGRSVAEAFPIALFYLLVILASAFYGARGGLIGLTASLGAALLWPGLLRNLGSDGAAFYLLVSALLIWIVASARQLSRSEREQRAHLSAVLAGIEDGVVAVDQHRRVRYLNAVAESMLGCSSERAEKRPIGELLAGLPEDAFDADAGSASRSTYHIDLSGSGAELTADVVRLQAGRDADSGHVLFLRRRCGDQPSLSDRKLRAVFDTEMWGICFADLDGGRWLANPRFRRMLLGDHGSETGTLDGRPPGELASDDLQHLGVPRGLLDTLRREGGFRPTEVQVLGRQGRADWVLLAGEALSGRDVALLALDISEHKRIDAALRAQRQLMRAMIDRLPALVAYIDIERRYRLFNRSFEDCFAGTPLHGMRVDEAHPHSDLAPYLPLLQRALEGQAVRFPAELLLAGERRHYDVQFVPHQPDGETVEGAVIHAVDITDRIEATRRVAASERRFRSLALAWAGIVWCADRDGRMLDAPGWEALTGQPPLQYRGDGWLDAIDPDDRARVRDAWGEALREAPAQTLDLEFRVRTATGEARYVALRAVPVLTEDETVAEWIGGIRDVHERRVFELQLRRAEAEQHALLDNLPKMVWIAEPDGGIRYQNRHWYEYTGLSGQEDWRHIVHPDDLDNGQRAWDQAIRAGRQLNVELRFRRADGAYRWHIVRAQPLFDDHGRLRCWYGASTDIEDQKRALETLAAANQRISRFLAVLSHELRNPLSGVSAASELLSRNDLPAADRERALATLLRQNRHLHRLVEDLLDISRVTQGDLELRRERFDLNRLLEEVHSDHVDRAGHEQVAIEAALPVEPCWVDGDRARLRQVFDNLLSNAVKASSPGQRIRIDAATTEEGALIEVSDQGQGLSRDLSTRLFEPFVQTPDWRSRGLGLGLSIVKTLVERHGGSVAAHSAGLGRGARFSVRLPLASPRSETAPSTALAEVEASLGMPRADMPADRACGRVLIVDDETDTAEALRVLLKLQGHHAECAIDAEQALAAWRRGAFDVVLCDLELPGPLNGYDIASTLRSQRNSPYLVAYSGYGQAGDRDRTAAVGFHEHLVKPAGIEEILASIQRGMRRAQAS
ncbi:PAS domain-containing protein [Lysobacter firmicutimachus]|uniref:histidine kinase n=1 Tax=Lysobacter firmicutimachus TaxID=1792846 RepID=A0AAU8MPT6_9GAMM